MYNNFSTIIDVKNKINELKGQNIEFEINKGRNKIVHLVAVIDKVYPSLFTIKPITKCDLDRTSYSYSDVLCGDIKF